MGTILKAAAIRKEWERLGGREAAAAAVGETAHYRLFRQQCRGLPRPLRLPVESGEANIENFPLGVLLGIEPWNFPYYQLARFVAPSMNGRQRHNVEARVVGAPVCARIRADVYRGWRARGSLHESVRQY